jgi:hypothetical protein
MAEYFTERQVLSATLERSRRMDFRVPMGEIAGPWQPVEVSITPEQYRSLWAPIKKDNRNAAL